MTADVHIRALRDYLVSAQKIAARLAKSVQRIADLFPLDAQSISALTDDDEERLDAFSHRFSSLAASVQDHVGRALLLAEEENLSEASRKDQRLLLEKLGALVAGVAFGVIAELRNRFAQSYPNDQRKQADVLNLGFTKSTDLISAFNGMLAYAHGKFGADIWCSDVIFPLPR